MFIKNQSHYRKVTMKLYKKLHLYFAITLKRLTKKFKKKFKYFLNKFKMLKTFIGGGLYYE
tara:strand:+ start:93 stop:275 length:183 start_codon:yes stop_codon:yes gene_type:complete